MKVTLTGLRKSEGGKKVEKISKLFFAPGMGKFDRKHFFIKVWELEWEEVEIPARGGDDKTCQIESFHFLKSRAIEIFMRPKKFSIYSSVKYRTENGRNFNLGNTRRSLLFDVKVSNQNFSKNKVFFSSIYSWTQWGGVKLGSLKYQKSTRSHACVWAFPTRAKVNPVGKQQARESSRKSGVGVAYFLFIYGPPL